MGNRIKHMLAPSSFRLKVIIISIICLVIPATISLSIYNYLTKDTLKDQAMSNADKELNMANEYVSKLLEDMLYIANFIQIDAEINTLLKMSAKSELEANTDQPYKRFQDEKKINKTIDNITLVGEKSYVTILLKNGKSYTNYSKYEYNPDEMFKEDWFKQLKGMEGYETLWLGPQPTVIKSEENKNPYQLSVARTLRDQSLHIYGYVIVTIMENKVNQIFENIKGYEDMMLLNSSNRIISHRDDSKIGERFKYEDQLNENNATNLFQILKKDYLIAEHDISFADWKVVSVTPYNHATSKINSIFRKMFIVQAVSFTIFLIFLAYMMRTITRPLVHLGKVAATVQDGNLEVRSSFRGSDEIGRLSKSFDQMLDRINEMIQEVTNTQERKRKAELAMLQAQINPHFLFNVLNSIRMKVMVRGDKEIAEIISSLSNLLRMTIDKNKENITLYEELQIVKDYIDIMNMRQKEKVNVEISVHEQVQTMRLPRFILQPIIENSFIHGLNQGSGNILVSTDIKKNEIILIIKDNGRGMNEQQLNLLYSRLAQSGDVDDFKNKPSKGFSSLGLSNVYERMRMTFGVEFRMEIVSAPGEGTEVYLFIPKGGGNPYV